MGHNNNPAETLRHFNIPPNLYAILFNYFCDRWVELPLIGTSAVKQCSGGCPQGGKISPLLWNILIDKLLKLPLPHNCHLQAYADDCLIFCEHPNADNCTWLVNNCLEIIYEWGLAHGLTFNPSKSEAMIITKKRKFNIPSIFLNDQAIGLVPYIKILGLVVDSKLSWSHHIDYISSKATKIFNIIKRRFGSLWGLSFDVLRTIYLQAIEPMILYACPVWHKHGTNMKRLLRIQRSFAIGMIRAYRTVSLEASLIIANIPPIHFKLDYLVKMFSLKNNSTAMDCSYESPIAYDNLIHPGKINLSVTNENDTCFQHQHYYHIYTDGSKFENYVGAAFVVFSVHENRIPFLRKMFRLDNRCSIYQAELLAVVEAINWVVDNNVPGVKIMSDSQAVLLSIQKIYSSNRMVQHIFQKIVNFNGHICFEWVKAHNGNFGNELADYLAKRAVESPILNYDLLPLSFFKYEFKKQLYCAWNEIWTTCSNGSTTKKFFPLVSIRSGINLSPDFILTQFLTNHGKFNQYLNRMRIKDQSSCFCGNPSQTSLHLILECDRFAAQRCFFACFCSDMSNSLSNMLDENIFQIKISPKNVLSNKNRTGD